MEVTSCEDIPEQVAGLLVTTKVKPNPLLEPFSDPSLHLVERDVGIRQRGSAAFFAPLGDHLPLPHGIGRALH